MLLTTEYMPKSKLYMITPLSGSKEPPKTIYLFTEFLEAKNFIDTWHKSPGYADFAYQARKAFRKAQTAERQFNNIVQFKPKEPNPS